MSSNPLADDPNPYAPPRPIEAAPPASRHPLERVIRDFRAQTLALGVAWIIIGSIAGGMSLLATTEPVIHGVIISIALIVSMACLLAGVATLCKQVWGFVLGLVVSYLAAIASVFSLNLCALVVLIMIILQGHRVIRFAKQIEAAGLSLNDG